MKHTIIGGVCGFALFFFLLCFWMWEIPPNLAELYVYERLFISVFALIFTALGAVMPEFFEEV